MNSSYRDVMRELFAKGSLSYKNLGGLITLSDGKTQAIICRGVVKYLSKGRYIFIYCPNCRDIHSNKQDEGFSFRCPKTTQMLYAEEPTVSCYD